MAINQGDVLRVTAVLSLSALSKIMNVYHIQVVDDDIPIEQDLLTAVADLLDLAYAQFNTVVSTEIDYEWIEVYNLTQDVPYANQAWPTLVSGIDGLDALPLQAAGLCVFQTNGKRSVGRKYISGLSESQSADGGKLVPGAVTMLSNYAITLVVGTAVGGATINFGNYRPATAEFIRWVGSGVRTYMRTQRRRVVGVGI